MAQGHKPDVAQGHKSDVAQSHKSDVAQSHKSDVTQGFSPAEFRMLLDTLYAALLRAYPRRFRERYAGDCSRRSCPASCTASRRWIL